MGPEHILFGTDSPPVATPLETALEIVNALPVSEADRAGILQKNAERLFNLASVGRAQERRWISN
jgi:predicted TIM-barrel fold metal-dependent hydrolase